MTLFEMISFAKVYNAALGITDRRAVTNHEIDTVIELLKKNADNRNDWTQDQKDAYKAIADYVKDRIKGT